jgi:hypothetical protein
MPSHRTFAAEDKRIKLYSKSACPPLNPTTDIVSNEASIDIGITDLC